MTLGNQISSHRKRLALTQDALAKLLGVSNQAVSKWEADQCCPDVMLLPKIADIFGMTLDELFGREKPQAPAKEAPVQQEPRREKNLFRNLKLDSGKLFVDGWDVNVKDGSLPWDDDGVLRAVLFVGHTLVKHHEKAREFTFTYDGPALNVDSAFSLVCGDVGGNADAGTSITCRNVGGSADAGSYIACGTVGGDADAGTYIECGDVGGDADAGSDIRCGNVGGDVDAGANVTCLRVEGDVDAGGKVIIGK